MNYKIGDRVLGTDVYQFNGLSWMHIYKVLAVENSLRFNKPDQLLTVCITTTDGFIVDHKVKRWTGQLF